LAKVAFPPDEFQIERRPLEEEEDEYEETYTYHYHTNLDRKKTGKYSKEFTQEEISHKYRFLLFSTKSRKFVFCEGLIEELVETFLSLFH
jgi:hypothetical protein